MKGEYSNSFVDSMKSGCVWWLGSALLVAVAREYRKARVFWEARIAVGKLAKNKHRAALRFNTARVSTTRAKTSVFRLLDGGLLSRLHASRIAGPPSPLKSGIVRYGHADRQFLLSCIRFRASPTLDRKRRASSRIRCSCFRWRASLGINSPPMPSAEAPARM